MLFEQERSVRGPFKKTLRIDDHGVSWGSGRLAWPDIVGVARNLEFNTINGAVQTRLVLDLVGVDGSKLKIRGTLGGHKRRQEMVELAQTIIGLVEPRVVDLQWPRVKQLIDAGQYTVGKTRLTADGIEGRKGRAPWSQVEGVRPHQSGLGITTVSGEVISREPATAVDGALLDRYIQRYLEHVTTTRGVALASPLPAAGPSPTDAATGPAAQPRGPHRSSSAAGRAVFGVALIAGFFIVGILALLASVAVAWWMLTSLDRIPVVVIILPFVIGFGVLAAFARLLRKAELPDTGLPLDLAAHPQLHQVIQTIAGQMRTPMPDRVHITHDVNAFVAQESRLLGLIPGKRMLAIGAPLLSTLTVSQLVAVLAHEFGHYAGGDTRLSGLTYAGQQAMIRSVEVNQGNIAGLLFTGYTKFYLRATRGVSRQQEFDADAAAVRLGGREAMASALVAVEHHAHAFGDFIDRFVRPLWSAGQHPRQLYQGFGERTAAQVAADPSRLTPDPTSQPSDPYDSHPPLGERLAAINHLEESPTIADNRPAAVLLNDADEVFGAIGQWLARRATGAEPTPVEWSVLADVHRRDAAAFGQAIAEAWAAAARTQATLGQMVKAVDLGDTSSPWWQVARQVVSDFEDRPFRQQRSVVSSLARQGVQSLVARQLTDRGAEWQFSVVSGPTLDLTEGGTVDLDAVFAAWEPGSDPTALAKRLAAEGIRGDLQLV